MKKTHLFIPLIIMLMLQGCMKCGKDVKLGEKKVMEESKEDYFPYLSIDEMTFVSSSGKVLTMKLEYHSISFLFDGIQYICYNNEFDYAREYYRNEMLLYKYEGDYYLNNYKLDISLYVCRDKSSSEVKYYDRLNCRYHAKGSAGKETLASFRMMVHDRGNTFTDTELSIANSGFEFAEEVEINGVVYHDVWHAKNKIFFQKHRGVFALEGLDEEFYVLQE